MVKLNEILVPIQPNYVQIHKKIIQYEFQIKYQMIPYDKKNNPRKISKKM